MRIKPFFSLILALLLFSGTLQTKGLTFLSSEDCDQDVLLESKINVISGECLFGEIDIEFSEPISIGMKRFYRNNEQFSGWSFFPQATLLCRKDDKEKSYQKQGKNFDLLNVICGEDTGSILSYDGYFCSSDDCEFKLVNPPDLVNISKEEISGKTNLKNNKLIFLRENQSFELTNGRGLKRIYRHYDHLLDEKFTFWKLAFGEKIDILQGSDVYCLDYEIHPNGNKCFYHYDQSGLLTKIEATNAEEKVVIGWIFFEYRLEKNPEIIITSSEGHEFHYYFDASGGLTRVYSLSKDDKYHYKDNLLVKKESKDGSFFEVEYLKRKNELKCQKLKTPNNCYEIKYENGNEKFTSITDQRKNKVLFFHKNKKIVAIEKYDDSEMLHVRKEKYFGKRKDANNIISEIIKDCRGSVYSCKTYQYDSFGNVIEERLYGNLAGEKNPEISLDKDGLPSTNYKGEVYLKKRGYSNDGFNLLLKQGDNKRGCIEYSYKQNSNLIEKKLIYERSWIRKL